MSQVRELVLGTRGSKLALRQAEWVAARLRRLQGRSVRLEPVTTRGDVAHHIALPQLPATGFFVREIEYALLEGRIDLAVHSAKDLPTRLPDGLLLAACTKRLDPRDVLVTTTRLGSWADLPAAATLATGSPRRQAFLHHARPEWQFVPLRGNLDTRLRRLREGHFDALVVARAGLIRLEVEGFYVAPLPPLLCVPAAGQGALALEARAGDHTALDAAQLLADESSSLCVRIERAILRELGAGCRTPIGVLAEASGSEVSARAALASVSGDQLVRAQAAGPLKESDAIVQQIVGDLEAQGARALIAPQGDP